MAGLASLISPNVPQATGPIPVSYNGKTLPQDAAPIVTPVVDATINPSLVIIGGTAGQQNAISLGTAVTQAASIVNGSVIGTANTTAVILPADVTWSIDWEKVIAESNILDGDPVTELIRNKAVDIEFSFTLWSTDSQGFNQFPQDDLVTLLKVIFRPNTVQPIQNTTLNKAGITQVIIKKLSASLVRGQTGVPCRLQVRQNVPASSSLILANPTS